MPAYATRLATLLLCAVAFAQLVPARAEAGPTSAAPVPVIFRRVLPDIKSRTEVPILLPGTLPAAARVSEVRHSDGRADIARYEVDLYGGAALSNATFIGYLAGERKPQEQGFGERVKLADGKDGYFNAKSCGGSCSPSQVEWWREGILYTLQLRLDVKSPAEEKRGMIDAANSAILGGPR